MGLDIVMFKDQFTPQQKMDILHFLKKVIRRKTLGLKGNRPKYTLKLSPIILIGFIQFNEQKSLIQNALSDIALSIEHIGSTAVAGLAAKPIIDINLNYRKS